ncbi:hypothetical protein LX87_05554 [Larkinella arboricola]|uniref:Carboxypeptidase family protein n=1 Tax=Larkinella arboricola TaxID=643671 RepID=A0A327WJB8_LARAB|nr:carboxypeptidase-like regulatory domain-containing protein [Larkinella arboricola]RAJ90028.1 hypothetical protein LX87_05554 [Larkinella arboricola]
MFPFLYSGRHPRTLLTSWLLTITLLTSCTESNEDPAPGPSRPVQAGYVVGKATDAQNKPLANVEVIAYNTLTNSTIGGRTDAQGNYRIKLENLGTWYVKGTATLNYDGGHYALRMHVVDPITFTHSQGAVQNMVLKASGERTGMYGEDGYYGAKITVLPDMTGDFYDADNAQLTFEPIGPLIDGSMGQTLICKPDNIYIYDIPVGKYKITATYQPTGQPLLLRAGYGGSKAYSRTITTMVSPTHSGSDRYVLELQVKPE